MDLPTCFHTDDCGLNIFHFFVGSIPLLAPPCPSLRQLTSASGALGLCLANRRPWQELREQEANERGLISSPSCLPVGSWDGGGGREREQGCVYLSSKSSAPAREPLPAPAVSLNPSDCSPYPFRPTVLKPPHGWPRALHPLSWAPLSPHTWVKTLL